MRSFFVSARELRSRRIFRGNFHAVKGKEVPCRMCFSKNFYAVLSGKVAEKEAGLSTKKGQNKGDKDNFSKKISKITPINGGKIVL